MKRAIISVSDKTGILELAKTFEKAGIEIISTGGTAKILNEAGVKVIPVSDITGFPECLDGRVKTLHPKIHAGILAQRDNEEHMKTIEDLGIAPIDYVVINLYPFKETIMNTDSSFEDCIENIDIGGPGMLRAAAKNYNDVTVVTDPEDYKRITEEIEKFGKTTSETRLYLAYKVFAQTAAYDSLIADYLCSQLGYIDSPDKISLTYEKVADLRYGENPHQRATFYKEAIPSNIGLTEAIQLNGKELSYNNIADTDACIALLKEFDEPTIVAVKHANPCGVGSADNIHTAWQKAYEGDSVSIFGGIVASNRKIEANTAAEMAQIFLEVVIAPSFSPEALEIFKEKKNLRVLKLPEVDGKVRKGVKDLKKVIGGLLVQDYNTGEQERDKWQTVTRKTMDKDLLEDGAFGMKVVKHVKSNAVILVKNKQTVGIGPGQPNRITSVKIAIDNAGEKAINSVMASDAFFPFPDCVQAAATAKISAIIQPGGSIRDNESIDECNKNDIPMVFTGKRHFKH